MQKLFVQFLIFSRDCSVFSKEGENYVISSPWNEVPWALSEMELLGSVFSELKTWKARVAEGQDRLCYS